jgi:hypothetical protein|nr:MAG TPA: YvrJ protein family protein [Caudoviricetes sp.]
MEEIVSMISNVGFPIGCCIVMFINNAKFTDALVNLNVTLKELSTRMETLENKFQK